MELNIYYIYKIYIFLIEKLCVFFITVRVCSLTWKFVITNSYYLYIHQSLYILSAEDFSCLSQDHLELWVFLYDSYYYVTTLYTIPFDSLFSVVASLISFFIRSSLRSELFCWHYVVRWDNSNFLIFHLNYISYSIIRFYDRICVCFLALIVFLCPQVHL